jgi:glycosyltransferase involved in cell wall biosynthesis
MFKKAKISYHNKLVLLFYHFETEHLGKEVFLIPYYLRSLYKLDVTIVYPQTKTNSYMPKEMRGIKLHPLKSIKPNKPNSRYIYCTIIFLLYLIRNSRKIDILMLVHIMHQAAIIGIVYKLLKNRGILYIKGDGIGVANINSEQRYMQSKNIKDYLIKLMFARFFRIVDFITAETDADYDRLCKNRIFGVDIAHKARQMYNGFDEDMLSLLDVQVNDFTEKKNIFLTVGRLGSLQKNTEMLLEVAKVLNWKDWKMVLVGNIENKERDFQQVIDDYFLTTPHLKDKVIFTGTIYSKKKLWTQHNDAKVFVMTSIHEGFANVYADAVRFRNYIISTDVGGASEMIREEEGYGEIVAQNNVTMLAQSLQKIIDNETCLENLYHKVEWENLDVSWKHYVRDAIKLNIK